MFYGQVYFRMLVRRIEDKYIRGFDGETCGKKTFGRDWHGWEDNIKIDLKEIGCEAGNLINYLVIETIDTLS